MLCRNCSFKSLWGETRDQALQRTIILIGIQVTILLIIIGSAIIKGEPNFWTLVPGVIICAALFFGNVFFDLRRADKHLNRNREDTKGDTWKS